MNQFDTTNFRVDDDGLNDTSRSTTTMADTTPSWHAFDMPVSSVTNSLEPVGVENATWR
jgi:hypothetical protein